MGCELFRHTSSVQTDTSMVFGRRCRGSGTGGRRCKLAVEHRGDLQAPGAELRALGVDRAEHLVVGLDINDLNLDDDGRRVLMWLRDDSRYRRRVRGEAATAIHTYPSGRAHTDGVGVHELAGPTVRHRPPCRRHATRIRDTRDDDPARLGLLEYWGPDHAVWLGSAVGRPTHARCCGATRSFSR